MLTYPVQTTFTYTADSVLRYAQMTVNERETFMRW